MSSSSRRLWPFFAVLSLWFPANRLFGAEEDTRTFPDFKCQLKLPGPDWSWDEKRIPKSVFSAASTKGFIVILTCTSSPSPVPMNQQAADGFEKGLYQPGQLDKRSGRFVTFKGLPCYQAEGKLADGRTVSARM